jgi:uncharacterized damage-inducible protein DinB
MLAGQARWAGENLAYNLDFVPDDKLAWKPSPTAKSALEIVNHTVAALKGMVTVLQGSDWKIPEFAPATNRAEAQALMREASAQYANALQQLSPEALERQVVLPFGTFPMREFSTFGTIDLMHHRGQIAYLQTHWGDNEDHFGPR